MSLDQESIDAINLVKGSCALCGATVYADESGYIEYKGSLFCTISCAEEATGDEIKTVPDTNGGYACPYCGEWNGQNDGASVMIENDRQILSCGHCLRECICDECMGGSS